MRIPILRVGDCLLATVQSELEDRLADQLKQDLSDEVSRTRARGVVLDVSALDIVDSYMGRVLADIASINRLLGARTAIVGIRPAVAITLVELGLDLPGTMTALDLDHGLRLLREASGRTG